MSVELPKKLKTDAIMEAVLEIRIEPDASFVSEIMYGRFADSDDWKDFRHARLPAADIPAPLRRADSKLKYLPSIELVSPDGAVSVRLGPHVVAYSRRGDYPGWEKFGSELEEVISNLYRIIPEVQVSRIGLRYINALRSDVHGINSIDDLDIELSVADGKLSSSLNLNFKSNIGTDFETISRIASVDMAAGNIPEHTTMVIDIDVYTIPGYSVCEADPVRKWIVEAHIKEKESFFLVLGREATERLREI